MEKLFVEKEIEINALPAFVWDAITRQPFTDVWSHEFAPHVPAFYLYCEDWSTVGSPVQWKTEADEVALEGAVTAVEPNKLLRFTVFDREHSELRPVFTEDDGISFTISQIDGHSVLHVRHGDFGKMANGALFQEQSGKAWDRALLKIRDLAEHRLHPKMHV